MEPFVSKELEIGKQMEPKGKTFEKHVEAKMLQIFCHSGTPATGHIADNFSGD